VEHASGWGSSHLIGLKALAFHLKWIGSDLPSELVRKASAGPGPLAIGRDDEDVTERNSCLSCSPQARRLDTVIVRDENQGLLLTVF
jgi:hypothetical protein